jgi:hypothetical protein
MCGHIEKGITHQTGKEPSSGNKYNWNTGFGLIVSRTMSE